MAFGFQLLNDEGSRSAAFCSAGGGDCGNGAMAAGFGAAATPFVINNVPGNLQVAAISVIGGTASVLGGGRFANGAVTAAFGYLYNAKNLFDTKGSDSLDSRSGPIDQSARTPNTTGDSIESYSSPDKLTDKGVNFTVKQGVNHFLTAIGIGPIFTTSLSVWGKISYAGALLTYSPDLNPGEDKIVRQWNTLK